MIAFVLFCHLWFLGCIPSAGVVVDSAGSFAVAVAAAAAAALLLLHLLLPLLPWLLPLPLLVPPLLLLLLLLPLSPLHPLLLLLLPPLLLLPSSRPWPLEAGRLGCVTEATLGVMCGTYNHTFLARNSVQLASFMSGDVYTFCVGVWLQPSAPAFGSSCHHSHSGHHATAAGARGRHRGDALPPLRGLSQAHRQVLRLLLGRQTLPRRGVGREPADASLFRLRQPV